MSKRKNIKENKDIKEIAMTTEVESDALSEVTMAKINVEDVSDSQSGQDDVNDESGENIENVYKVIEDLDMSKINRVEWFKVVPRKYQLQPGDIVYNYEVDRFGVFISPSYKDGLARTRLFKIGSKDELYARDWFVNYDSLILVKRKDRVRGEFIETDSEFARRAGKSIRSIDTNALREVAASRVIQKELKVEEIEKSKRGRKKKSV